MHLHADNWLNPPLARIFTPTQMNIHLYTQPGSWTSQIFFVFHPAVPITFCFLFRGLGHIHGRASLCGCAFEGHLADVFLDIVTYEEFRGHARDLSAIEEGGGSWLGVAWAGGRSFCSSNSASSGSLAQCTPGSVSL